MRGHTTVSTLRLVAALVVLGATGLLAGCGFLEEDKFAVGDCVRIDERVADADLEKADCSDAVGTFDASARTYRVNSIIDNTDGGCPELAGFFPVEFVHQPHGVTYCLVQED